MGKTRRGRGVGKATGSTGMLLSADDSHLPAPIPWIPDGLPTRPQRPRRLPPLVVPMLRCAGPQSLAYLSAHRPSRVNRLTCNSLNLLGNQSLHLLSELTG